MHEYNRVYFCFLVFIQLVQHIDDISILSGYRWVNSENIGIFLFIV